MATASPKPYLKVAGNVKCSRGIENVACDVSCLGVELFNEYKTAAKIYGPEIGCNVTLPRPYLNAVLNVARHL